MAFGNISSYAAAGRSATSAGSSLLASQRERSNPDEILKAAMKARAEEKLNVMKIESELAQTAIKATGKAANQAIASEADNRVSAIKGKTQAMAGKVAMLAETSKMFKNKRSRPKSPGTVDYSSLLEDADKRVNDAQDKITNFKPTTMDTPPETPAQASPGEISSTQFRTGSTGLSTGPHLDARVWSKSRKAYINDPSKYMSLITTADGKPISSFPVTSGPGVRTHPVTGEAGKMHYGIDYGTPKGTVLNVAAPFVERTRDQGGGNMNIYRIDDDLELVLMHGAD